MSVKLSIIIPCYNCEKTLEEAVSSCYTQGFSESEFEIVMVDDKSTDITKEIMMGLSKEYSNIHLYFHEENKGGGATRNTAVSNTSGNIIFCLDSDDILPPHTLKKMHRCLIEKKLDGILFEETRFFTTNKNNTEIAKNNPKNIIVKFSDVFQDGAGFLTQVNFMYTKESFLAIGGYPTDHGFDTQSFGLKFLAYEQKCTICKDTYYLHRHHQKNHKSYYQREYEKGLLSINTFLALEPIIEKFNSGIINEIINFDIFSKNYHGDGTHLRSIMTGCAKNNRDILRKTKPKPASIEYFFIDLCKNIDRENYEKAFADLIEILKLKNDLTEVLLYMQLRILFGLSGVRKRHINQKVSEYLMHYNLLKKRKYKHLPKILKPLLYFYKIFKN